MFKLAFLINLLKTVRITKVIIVKKDKIIKIK